MNFTNQKRKKLTNWQKVVAQSFFKKKYTYILNNLLYLYKSRIFDYEEESKKKSKGKLWQIPLFLDII